MNACLLVLLGLFTLFSCKQKPDTIATSKEVTPTVAFRDEKPVSEKTKKSQLALSMESQGMIDIDSLDASVQVDLKYATTDNFTRTILYDSLTQAYLHPVAAGKLVKAQKLLKDLHPDYSLIIYDAARPLSVQKKMYNVVRNTKYHAYVADPQRTGMHNYGMAVDVSICGGDSIPLDMGTPFDYFGSAAGINKEEQLRIKGVLTRKQIDNRKLLRQVMTEAGFITIRGEWWHFDAMTLAQAKKACKLIR